MQIDRNPLRIGVKAILLIWGGLSLIKGLGLSFFVNGANQYLQTAYIELVYESVLIGVLISIFSNKLAALALGLVSVLAAGILYDTNFFGHGASALYGDGIEVAIRPALACLTFFILSVSEGRSSGKSSVGEPHL